MQITFRTNSLVQFKRWLTLLRCMDTPPFFSAIIAKGNNFCDFPSAPLDDEFAPRLVNSYKRRHLLKWRVKMKIKDLLLLIVSLSTFSLADVCMFRVNIKIRKRKKISPAFKQKYEKKVTGFYNNEGELINRTTISQNTGINFKVVFLLICHHFFIHFWCSFMHVKPF